MYGKSNIETYITLCKIDSQWEFAVCLRKLKQGLCINLEGWDGWRDGREFQKGGIYVYLWLMLGGIEGRRRRGRQRMRWLDGITDSMDESD